MTDVHPPTPPQPADAPPSAPPGWRRDPDGSWHPTGPQWPPPAGGPPPGWYQGHPGAMGPSDGMAKPSSNMVGAVLSTFLCFLPLGVVACIYAAQVDSKWNAGDRAGAVDASKKARLFANLALGVALVMWIGLISLGAFSTTPKQTFTPVTYVGGPSEAYLDCLADPDTTFAECDRLYGN